MLFSELMLLQFQNPFSQESEIKVILRTNTFVFLTIQQRKGSYFQFCGRINMDAY